jgi:hypothetical protein
VKVRNGRAELSRQLNLNVAVLIHRNLRGALGAANHLGTCVIEANTGDLGIREASSLSLIDHFCRLA